MAEQNGTVPLTGQMNLLPTRTKWNERERHWSSEGFAATFPAIWELMSRAKDQEGHYRCGSALMFVADADKLKCCINDKATGNSAWVTIDGELPWLEQVEEYLQGGADWRPNRRKA